MTTLAPSARSDTPTDVSLQEIASWQLAPPDEMNFRVQLPKLQRGFVWEPSKVMDLWDSILRGFPIGSMMISAIETASETGQSAPRRYWLLDGQQRATSIAIGYCNPWDQRQMIHSMWSLKDIPILWIDLQAEPKEWDTKMFFPFLVTRSHPWGYNRDGGLISWGQRTKACETFKLGENYTAANLEQCFPWDARFPVPLALLLEVSNRKDINDERALWLELVKIAKSVVGLPYYWIDRYGCKLDEPPPVTLATIFKGLRRVPNLKVHLNLLSRDAAENDGNTDDDNSLLFVRLNTGGVVLAGEELIFSLFKSVFGEAKDTVEECAAGFMAPSKLFGLLVRLAAAEEDAAKISRPVSLRDFKKEIRSSDSTLKKALEALIHKDDDSPDSEAARLMKWARSILCGPEDSALDFCLPEAVATRSINSSPDIFLALLYWRRNCGDVTFGSEEHRRLIGCFTALSWFLPGNARAKQEALRDWVTAAGTDVAGRLWSAKCLRVLFTRTSLALPVFPQPDMLKSFLLQGVLDATSYRYEALTASNPAADLWDLYDFLPEDVPKEDQAHLGRERNLKSFLDRFWPCRNMLLYAQRSYIGKRFKGFDQWELALKDTNCPWDWDHIYPSASGLHNVNPLYKDWHDTIGNLRAEGLSENRSDGCKWPTDKLCGEDADSVPIWKNSFITDSIWSEMQGLKYQNNAIKDPETGKSICGIVLKRLVSIYEEWHGQLLIGPLMTEIRSIAIDARDREISAEPSISSEFISDSSAQPA